MNEKAVTALAVVLGAIAAVGSVARWLVYKTGVKR